MEKEMEFNITKRKLEKGTAIYSTIAFSLLLVASIVVYILCNTTNVSIYDSSDGSYFYGSIVNTPLGAAYFSISIIEFFVSIVCLILSAKLIKSPLQADGTIKTRTKIRVTLLIFSIFSGNIVTLGLIIAVLCLEDFKNPQTQKAKPTDVKVQTKPVKATKRTTHSSTPNEEKLAELKRLKELGLIDEENYKQAVSKIIASL